LVTAEGNHEALHSLSDGYRRLARCRGFGTRRLSAELSPAVRRVRVRQRLPAAGLRAFADTVGDIGSSLTGNADATATAGLSLKVKADAVYTDPFPGDGPSLGAPEASFQDQFRFLVAFKTSFGFSSPEQRGPRFSPSH